MLLCARNKKLPGDRVSPSSTFTPSGEMGVEVFFCARVCVDGEARW
jgi:hypothetical protein